MKEVFSPQISVIGPIEPALERVKTILFRPFDFEKWIAIAFCAWLAALAGGGANYSYKTTNRNNSVYLHHMFWEVREHILHNLHWIIPLAVGILIVVIAVVIGLLWLSSRGQFMFLHCVVHNSGEVSSPWKKYKSAASSFWKFRMILAALSVANVLFFMSVLGWAYLNFDYRLYSLGHPAVILLLLISIAFVMLVLVLSLTSIFTRHFVVPIMYIRGGSCIDSWRVFLELFRVHWVQFLLYLLFQIVLAFAFILVILIGTFCTCCIAGLLLLIPFVGTVLLLPIRVFAQSYQLYYLAQYGPEFDVFQRKDQSPNDPSFTGWDRGF